MSRPWASVRHRAGDRHDGLRAEGHDPRSPQNPPPVSLVVLALFAVLSGCRPAESARDAAAHPQVTSGIAQGPGVATPSGDPARRDVLPESVTDLEGRVWPLSAPASQASNGPPSRGLALVFVLQDCPVANSYAPLIERLHQEFSRRAVRLLVVQADPRASVEVLREHARTNAWTVPVVADPGHQLVRGAGATAAPQAIVWDARGAVVYSGRIDDQFAEWGKKRPAPTRHDLREVLTRLADGQEVEPTKTPVVGCYLKDLRPIPAPQDASAKP